MHIVKAAQTEEYFAWLQNNVPAVEPAVSTAKEIRLTDRSAKFGGVAIQGPRIAELFHALSGIDADLPSRNSIADLPFDGTTVSVERTGYTGEDGIEIFCRATDAVELWSSALEKGKPFGIKP